MRVPRCRTLGIPVRFAASSAPSMPLRQASEISLRTADSRTFTVEGERSSIQTLVCKNACAEIPCSLARLPMNAKSLLFQVQ